MAGAFQHAMRRRPWLTVPLACLALPAAPAAAARECPEPTGGWRQAAPAEVGLDARILAAAVHSYQDRRGYAVRVYRHGCLVGQDTNGSAAARAQFETWGLTRTLTSLLAGRAMELGLLAPEEPVGAFLPEASAAHGALRVRDLLTLTSGLRSDPVRDEDVAVPDRLHDALVTEVAHQPGTRFHESPGAGALLVAVLERALGEDVQGFAQRELLGPIGVRAGGWRWIRDERGRSHGSYGLNMNVDDVARLGELVRRGGVWDGRRLLAERWMREALAPGAANPCHGWLVFTNAERGCTRTQDGTRYASNDRLLPRLPADVWQFRGRFDQLVTTFPALGIMVVRLGTRSGDARSGEDGGRWEADVGRQLLGAVRDAEPALTRERGDLVIRGSRPYDQPERLRDSLAPWFPPPLPPPGPARARAVVVDGASERVGRRRLVTLRVTCPARARMACAGELELEGARRPAAFAVEPGAVAPVRLRLAQRLRKPIVAPLRARTRDEAGGTEISGTVVLRP